MFNTAQHLCIRRPSPTTVEYTVTNYPAPTLTNRLLLVITSIVRVSVSLFIFLILYCKLQLSSVTAPLESHTIKSDSSTSDFFRHQIDRLVASHLGQRCSYFASRLPTVILLPGTIFVLYLLSIRFYKSESLLVLRSLGVQTSSSSPIFGIGHTTRFIPTGRIQDILINEVFLGFEVRYCLTVVVEGEMELLVVFPKLSPRRELVEEVWRGSRACLWEGYGDRDLIGRRKKNCFTKEIIS